MLVTYAFFCSHTSDLHVQIFFLFRILKFRFTILKKAEKCTLQSIFSSTPKAFHYVSHKIRFRHLLDPSKMLNLTLTYREYKEALRQQRNQDSTAIYRPKEQQTPTDSTPSSTDSPTSFKSQNSTPSPTIFSSNQSSPSSPQQAQKPSLLDQKNKNGQTNGKLNKSTVTFANQENDNQNNRSTVNKNDESATDGMVPISLKKPVQKVTPSRNTTNATYQSPSNWTINGNHKTVEITTTVTKEYNVYVKPSSPTKSTQGNLSHSNVPAPVSTNGKGNGTNKVGPKANR